MALVDVSANPLNVVVQLFFALGNAGATQNAQYQQTNQALINALPFLPSSLQALLSPIAPFLQAPLGSVFNSAWAGQKSAAESFAAGQLQSTAGGGGQSVSNVSCSLAQNGTVLAGVTPAQGANPAGLVIDFHLPGGEFRFSSGPKALKAIRQTVRSWSLHQRSDKTLDDLARMFNAHVRGWINYYGRFYPSALYPTLRHFWAAWRINFDADITVTTPVPTEPFNLAPVAQATLSNASMHPDNVGADFDQFIDDFFTALGNFFTGGNYISDVDWDEQVYSQETDQTQNLPASIAAPMLSLFSALNSAGPECVGLGLTQYAFSIANNSTLTLTITHPRDPGPTLVDAYHPLGVLVSPTLAATSSQVVPGGSVTAIGGNFPVDTTTSLSLQWSNTTSGTPTQAQLRYNGANYTVQAPANAPPNHLYTYNPTGLAKGATTVFEARCGDMLTWSDWGPAFSLATISINIVELTLSPVGGGQVWTLGSAPLPPANASWTCSGTIPAAAPAGQYNLEARLAGTLIAETQISIVTTLTPRSTSSIRRPSPSSPRRSSTTSRSSCAARPSPTGR